MLATLFRLRSQIDLVSIQTYSGPAFINADIVSWLARRLGIKVLLVLHGGALPEFAACHPIWVRKAFQRANLIIAPSNYLATMLQSLGFPIRIIPNAIDIHDYPYRHRFAVQPKLIWMRTFHEIYNPLMAVQVLQQLIRTRADAHLTMAGQDKGMFQTVQDYVKKIGLEDRVSLIGFLDSDGKRAQFSRHDIYLNTNRIDNTPVSVIEAAAFGLPIISTNVGGVPYLVENKISALLVEDGDVYAMTKDVQRLLAEPDLAARLSVEARALAEKFDWSNILLMWKNLFMEAIA